MEEEKMKDFDFGLDFWPLRTFSVILMVTVELR